jgi:hypothetical protein
MFAAMQRDLRLTADEANPDAEDGDGSLTCAAMARRRYELCPDELLDEFNGDRNTEKITALLRKYRAQKR